MINFSNTQIAFQHKNTKELKRSWRLFILLAENWRVKGGKLLIYIATKIHFPIRPFVLPIFRHFCGGENIAECATIVSQLAQQGVKSIPDYSVESGENITEYEEATNEIIKTIDFAAHNKSVAYAVFKPSALTREAILYKASSGTELNKVEAEDFHLFEQRVHRICQAAHEADVPVMIDAEESWIQPAIDHIVESMMNEFNKSHVIVYNTFQMYRKGQLEWLIASYSKAVECGYFLGAKFVRGAYMERERLRAKQMNYESPIQPDKPATDKAFDDALKFSVEHIDRIGIFCGTHNEESCNYLAKLMKEHNIERNNKRICFSQLYGMSDHISYNLAHEGFQVAKYLPYGPIKRVLPYLIRRAEENTSVKGQTGRELYLITTELKRRKKAKKDYLKK